MHIDVISDEGVTHLSVTGEVDLAVADDLRKAGIAALTPLSGTLRIDLSGVTFIDSTGLAALVAINNAAGDTHTVILDRPSSRVHRVLTVSGLDLVLQVDTTVTQTN
jgi:anti-sigma B factor antagonist